jgi:hypothetical protein
MDGSRHVIGYHSTQHSRDQNALDDVAITIHQSLHAGAGDSMIPPPPPLPPPPPPGGGGPEGRAPRPPPPTSARLSTPLPRPSSARPGSARPSTASSARPGTASSGGSGGGGGASANELALAATAEMLAKVGRCRLKQ